MDVVVLFFVLGVLARVVRSDLRLPESMYEALSIFLLLTIGLKGGVELASHPLASLLPQALAVILFGCLLPFIAYPVLRLRFPRVDAAAIAAHYGSVSVVTFAVATSYLAERNIPAEPYLAVFLALLEVPAIVVGVMIARAGRSVEWGPLAREVLLGKSVVLLLGGLAIGWIAGARGVEPIGGFFFGLLKGVLALFMLEMGLVVANRIGDLRRAGVFLVAFAIGMPLVGGALGALLGSLLGLSPGGCILLAVLGGSASYIAAPAALRLALPEANPTFSLAAALGVTFPFNVIVGIPIYHRMGAWASGQP